MRKSLVALSLLASCSFGVITTTSAQFTNCSYRSSYACGNGCSVADVTGFLCNGQTIGQSNVVYHNPPTDTCGTYSVLYSSAYFNSNNSCTQSSNNECTTPSGANGRVIKDGNSGDIGCYSLPRNSDYDKNSLAAICGTGFKNIGGKCLASECPAGMTCGTNANGSVKMTGADNKIYTRTHPNGDIDAIMPNGAYTTYDKNGNPVRHVDANGNIVADATAAGTQSVATTDPRGSPFNPVISAGLVANGYLLASAGVLASASGLGSLPGAGMITVGGIMVVVGGGNIVAAAIPKSSSTSSGSTSSGGSTQGIEIDIRTIDTGTTSGGSSSGGGATSSNLVVPGSTTTSTSGAVTKVYKPDTATTITETTNTDGSRDYQVKDNTTGTVQTVTTPPNYFNDNGATNLTPPTLPVTTATDTSSVTGSGGTYIPDPATGGYIPANPQTSGGGTSGGGTTSGGTTSGGSSSTGSGGSMGDGQTSAPAGTDGSGSTSGTGEGKDFGDGFGDFLVFKDWDSTLKAVDDFKKNISDSFTNLNKSISDAKNAFQGDKIHASIGSGAPCNLSFATTFGSADFTAGMTKAADIFRPFIIFIVSISLSVLSFFGLYKVIRGGAE